MSSVAKEDTSLQDQRDKGVDKIGQDREVPLWEREDAPPGSTSESLLEYENGKPVRVSPATHYHHLANGRVVPGHSGGTHYTEPSIKKGEPDKVIAIIQIYEG